MFLSRAPGRTLRVALVKHPGQLELQTLGRCRWRMLLVTGCWRLRVAALLQADRHGALPGRAITELTRGKVAFAVVLQPRLNRVAWQPVSSG